MMEQQKKRSRQIKPIDIVSVIMLLVIATILAVLIYSYFHPKTQNVFDRLYYEVRAVKHGRDSVLISGTKSAYADYDFGTFDHIAIPVLNTSLYIEGDTLYILFSNHEPDADWRYVLYKYHLKEKRLYGERSLEFLIDNFLNDYFTWCSNAGESNPYSQEDLGEYEFELQENVYYD